MGLVVAVYHPVRDHEFVNYDDHLYVVDNPKHHAGLSLDTLVESFTTPYETNWIPLTWVSLQIDYALYGDDPMGYHLTNVALHAASAVLLLLALARMTGAPLRSGFVAAVFALHPLHVESVAWVSERKDTLSGLFWMLALLAYARHAERPRAGRYALVVAAYALALLAKPMAITLPFALLLLDYWPLHRLRRDPTRRLPDPSRLRAALLEKLPLFAIAAVASAVTFTVQRDLGAMDHGDALPFGLRLENALVSYVWYVGKGLWPSGLAAFYPHPFDTLPAWQVGGSALLLLAVTWALARAAASHPYAITGWLWFLGTLVPVIGIVQVGMQARADRYTYLPFIGLSWIVAWGAVALAERARVPRPALAGVGLGVVAALAVTAHAQVGTWRDTLSLFGHAREVTEDNFFAHHGLGSALLLAGRPEEAAEEFRQALRTKPRWPGAHVGLGDALHALGDYEGAIAAYEEALRLDPAHARGNANLGKALTDAGRPREAIRHLRRALARQGGHQRAATLALLGESLFAAGDVEGAIEQYRKAVELDPGLGDAHANLGIALGHVGSDAEALAALSRARSLGVSDPEVSLGLAEVAVRLGRPREAIGYYREALRLRPAWAPAANNLAWLLATHADASIRDPAEAVRIATEATRAPGGDEPWLLDTLAASYAAAGRFAEAARTADRAASLARDRGDAALAAKIEARRADYEASAAAGEAGDRG